MKFNQLIDPVQERVLNEVYSNSYEMGTPLTKNEALNIANSYEYNAAGEPIKTVKEITVYTSRNCGRCLRVKAWLMANNWIIKEIRIDEQANAKEKLLEHGFKNLPVVSLGSLDNAFSVTDSEINYLNEFMKERLNG